MTNNLSLTKNFNRVSTDLLLNAVEFFFPPVRERRNVLERQILTDELTRLGNRAAFNKAEPEAITRGMSFIMFDANNFGRINKQCGHTRGDETLQKIAKVISEVSRNYKVQAFRLGGDEFVMICPSKFAKRVRDAVEKRFLPIDFGNFIVSISGETGSSVEDADSRLQERKAVKKEAR